MSDPRGAMTMQFPRPGKVLRGVMWLVAGLAILWAIIVHWVPGGDRAFLLLTFKPAAFMHGEFWRIFTAGLLSPPIGGEAVSHLFFTLLGLFFLSPDLERRWGGARFAWFLGTCLFAGFLLTAAIDGLPFGGALMHPGAVFGMGAAITGTAVAWSRENANLEVRLFFVLPVKGSQFLWLTVGWCVLEVIFQGGSTEGVVAPFGGILAGLAFGGSPSPLRAAYLRWKLASLRKRTGGLSAAAMLEPNVIRRRPGPPLRVVSGGLDDPKKDPPRDKRFLN